VGIDNLVFGDSTVYQIDTDGDGFGDVCDVCPNDAANDIDGDFICADVDVCPTDPGNDDDGDGICAGVDTCPGIPNEGANEDANLDGIGDYCQCGDINGDGIVNNVDSILVKRADLGLSVGGSYNPALCDVNGDGNCNNVDSILIKRADLGLSVGGSFRTMCGPMP
jgi:hypothetical protein